MDGTRVLVKGVRDVTLEKFEVDPERIESGQILVRPYYTLISAGTELAIYTGRDPRVYKSGEWCSYPFYPGVIGVCQAIRVGDGVHHVRPGDKVFCYSHHASLDIIDAEEFLCLPLPSGVPLRTGLLARHATIALTSLRLSRPEIGDRALVFGLGLVGNFVAQLLLLAGVKVLAVDPIDSRRKLAAHSANIMTLSPEQVSAEAVSDLLSGPPDIVVDAVGSSSLILEAVRLLRPGGQLILLGTAQDEYQTDLTPILREIHFKWLNIRGALEWCFPPYGTSYQKHSYEGNTRAVFDLFQSGRLHIEGLISHTVTPDKFQSGYEGLLNQKEHYIGVAVRWPPESFAGHQESF